MAILVTGGAGYIGSHTVIELQNAGYDVVVCDNLCNSSKKSLERVEKITGKPVKFYLADICSVKELDDLAQRLEVATMLAAGAPYVEVSKATGASSTTVSRVSKCLNGARGGYRLVLSRMDDAQE